MVYCLFQKPYFFPNCGYSQLIKLIFFTIYLLTGLAKRMDFEMRPVVGSIMDGFLLCSLVILLDD